MDSNKTTIERAFDLARSGTCLSLNDIVGQLKSEGYAMGQIEGPSLNKQLRDLIEKATKQLQKGPTGDKRPDALWRANK